MIYYVSNNLQLFNNDTYKVISLQKSLDIISKWKICQFDTETTGRDARINKILLAQFGNKEEDIQIVVDVTTVSLLNYKQYLETHLIIGQNLKFDLQFLYTLGIVPLNVYDIMIIEQLLYLGYPPKGKYNGISYSLKAIADRYLGINIDKSIRGQIIWRGIDDEVIKYAAGDVLYLEDIRDLQLKKCKKRECLKGVELENAFVPVIAYMEWCGIKLDVNKWKAKMLKDEKNLSESIEKLNKFVVDTPILKQFVYIEKQGDLFSGFNTVPQVNINWSSNSDMVKVCKLLGFSTSVVDKKSGETKNSAMAKHLKKQKGINDEFLRLYFGKGNPGDKDYFPGYSGSFKVVSSFGQGHLDAINPITGRIHTQYRQLGADTGRMSCGSKQSNIDLANYKKISPTRVRYPNLQQLPHDVETRAAFVSEEGNLWASGDYAAIESRLGADIYQEQAMIEEFLHGSGDIHSLTAKKIFKELKDVPVKDIKKLYPKLRTEAKPIEFSQQFGGSEYAIQNAKGCSLREAKIFAEEYAKGFPGIARFKIEGAKKVIKNGYILLNPITGHKTYWHDHKDWIERQKSFNKSFWEDYRLNHKGTNDAICLKVKHHFQAKGKWSRKALNSVTQGTGSIILKHSQIKVFRWVVANGYFNKILLVNLSHDEANWEFPKELIDTFPEKLKDCMESSADRFCKSLPIPADIEVSDHWVH